MLHKVFPIRGLADLGRRVVLMLLLLLEMMAIVGVLLGHAIIGVMEVRTLVLHHSWLLLLVGKLTVAQSVVVGSHLGKGSLQLCLLEQ